MSITSIIGYHATEEDNEASIRQDNFLPSSSPREWLGKGAYFFVEGITSPGPIENAVKWAKEHKQFLRYIVLRASIEVEEECCIDLRTKDGNEALAALRKLYMDFFYIKGRKKPLSKPTSIDVDILDEAGRFSKQLKVVVNAVYIRFAEEKNFGIASYVPNATIACVKTPKENILLDSIQKVTLDGLLE